MAVLTDEPVFVSDIPEPNPRRGDSLEWNTGVRWLLAGCSLGAAVVHFGYAPAHFSEYWLYGLFFVVVAWLQVLWAAAIVVRTLGGCDRPAGSPVTLHARGPVPAWNQ